MTQAQMTHGQGGPTATEDTVGSVVDEQAPGPFSYADLARLDEALTRATEETGLRFTLFVGELGKDSRSTAEDLHSRSGGNPPDDVLVALSPGQRVLEIVTGSAAARRVPDRACALAVLTMTKRLGAGDLTGAIVAGLRQLSDAAQASTRGAHTR